MKNYIENLDVNITTEFAYSYFKLFYNINGLLHERYEKNNNGEIDTCLCAWEVDDKIVGKIKLTSYEAVDEMRSNPIIGKLWRKTLCREINGYSDALSEIPIDLKSKFLDLKK